MIDWFGDSGSDRKTGGELKMLISSWDVSIMDRTRNEYKRQTKLERQGRDGLVICRGEIRWTKNMEDKAARQKEMKRA